MTKPAENATATATAMLDLYRRHPHTTGRVRKADRALAKHLDQRSIPLTTFKAALLLAAARRNQAKDNTTAIRSLHYFLPVIEELLDNPPLPGYVDYLGYRLAG